MSPNVEHSSWYRTWWKTVIIIVSIYCHILSHELDTFKSSSQNLTPLHPHACITPTKTALMSLANVIGWDLHRACEPLLWETPIDVDSCICIYTCIFIHRWMYKHASTMWDVGEEIKQEVNPFDRILIISMGNWWTHVSKVFVFFFQIFSVAFSRFYLNVISVG